MMPNKAKELLTVVVATLATVLIGELGLEQFGLVPKIETGWGWSKSPQRNLQPEDASLEINEQGLRGKRHSYSDQDIVVLLVGDSQVEAAATAVQFMPEALLQDELTQRLNKPVKVFSLASSGWGQDQQLLALEKYFESKRADFVLVWASPHNDFWENTFPVRGVTVRDAGHVKPTFRLDRGALEGPIYGKDFYYKKVAFMQLIAAAYYRKPINQLILEDWKSGLPSSTAHESAANCDSTTEISQRDFFKDIFEIDHTKKYTLLTLEDVEHSRSNFSPLASPRTDLDDYEKAITRALFARMQSVSNAHGAKFNVFYPLREDFDVGGWSIQCLKTTGGRYFQYSPDFRTLLNETISPEHLIYFELAGKNENVVSKDDRHLGVVGNTKAMSLLAAEIASRYKNK